MIRRVNIKNIMSYRGDETLDFEITKKTNLDQIVHYNTQSRIPKAVQGSTTPKTKINVNLSNLVLIYGKNNSGKTCFFEILRRMSSSIVHGSPLTILPPYATQKDLASEFEIEFLTDTAMVRYGASFIGDMINSEWLYANRQMSNRETRIFFREGKDLQYTNQKFSNLLYVIKETSKKTDLYLSKILNLIKHNQNDEAVGLHEQLSLFLEIANFFTSMNWVEDAEGVSGSPLPLDTLENFTKNEEVQHLTNTYLAAFDTNIKKIRIEKLGSDTLGSLERFQQVAQAIASLGSVSDEQKMNLLHDKLRNSTVMSDIENLNFVANCRDDKGNMKNGFTVKADMYDEFSKHSYTIDYSDLSFGTKKIINYLLVILLSEQRVFIIDEFEHGLHPLAFSVLIAFILENVRHKPIQFILASHCIELLDNHKISNEAKILLDNLKGTEVNYVSEFPICFKEKVSSKVLNGSLPGSPVIGF